MIRAAIIGATGYAGAELVRILLAHPGVRITALCSRTYKGQVFSDLYPHFRGCADITLSEDDIEKAADDADVVFTATPQGYLAGVISESLLSRVKVIDLSADFRLKDVAVYEHWYGIRHASPQFLGEAVYGLCEINRAEVKTARLVANPGCYTTCSILTLYPALEAGLIDPDSVIVDALSGVSGAGANAKKENLFCEVNESVKPYGIAVHRHTPEIEEQLSKAAGRAITLNFTPHLVPLDRGILATCYADLKPGKDGKGLPSEEEIRAVYARFYKDEKFIRLCPAGVYPETRFVARSNLLDIGICVDPRTKRLILTGAIDNLGKGAAGQAVQNMNLLFGLPEETGL